MDNSQGRIPAIHSKLSYDFFESEDEIEVKCKKNRLKLSEPKEIEKKNKKPPPKFEQLNNMLWLTSGTLTQMVEFMTGPVQSKKKHKKNSKKNKKINFSLQMLLGFIRFY